MKAPGGGGEVVCGEGTLWGGSIADIALLVHTCTVSLREIGCACNCVYTAI